MAEGRYNQPNDKHKDNTVFTYMGKYKLSPSCTIMACNHINSYNEQQSYINKGSIQVDFTYSMGTYAPYNLKWVIPLHLLGFNPFGNYETIKDKIEPALLVNEDDDGDSVAYNLEKNGRMLMRDPPNKDQEARGVVPYVLAICRYENAHSRLYDPTNAAMQDFTRQELTAEFEQAVLDNFFVADDKGDSGHGYGISLVPQIKDVTQNKFTLIEIFEFIDPKKTGLELIEPMLFPVFFDEDHKMTYLVKEIYASKQYKAGESRALLQYIDRQGEPGLIFLPLLCLVSA